MARVSLSLEPARGAPVFRFVRPGGAPGSIPALELRAHVRLVPHVRLGRTNALRAGYPECIVDTGAPLSIVPEYIWSHFHSNAVTPLPFDPAMPQHHRSVTVGGGRYPYDLGELTLRLVDHRRTMDLNIVAQFTRDNGALTIPMVLGLSGGVIDGRILRSEPDPAAPFGQAWTLEDP